MAQKKVAESAPKTKTDPPSSPQPDYLPRLKVVLTGDLKADPEKLNCPERTWQVVRDLETADREHLVVLHLDASGRLLARETVSVGTVTSAAAHARSILTGAILNHSASIVLAHNHPSGDPMPSKQDRAVTEQVKAVAALFDIELRDHLVIGDGRLYSISAGRLIDMRPLPRKPAPPLEETRKRGRPRKVVPECPEEELLIKAYRRVYQGAKRSLIIAAEVSLESQARKEEIVRLVAEGKPLTDEQAETWSWLREQVEKGEFTA